MTASMDGDLIRLSSFDTLLMEQEKEWMLIKPGNHFLLIVGKDKRIVH